jgi:hypothetical protein
MTISFLSFIGNPPNGSLIAYLLFCNNILLFYDKFPKKKKAII